MDKAVYYLYGQQDIRDTVSKFTLMQFRRMMLDQKYTQQYRLKYYFDKLYKRYEFQVQILINNQWMIARVLEIYGDFKLSDKWTKENI